MKKVLLATLMIAAAAAVYADVVGSSHDLSTGSGTTGAATDFDEVCAFCHTPHQPAGTTQDPLWNHNVPSTTTYSVYQSATLNAYTGDTVNLAGTVSLLCMSCHDGTVGLGSLINPPNELGSNPSNSGTFITGNALLGTDLSNDHPVAFAYQDAIDNGDLELNAATGTPAALLFGGNVECASCHDPHDTTHEPFLVMDNADSAICTQCHAK